MAGTPSKGRHKPRRKGRSSDDDLQLTKSEVLYRAPSFPLAAFMWPARGSVSQWEVLPLQLMVVGLFKWAAGLWGYSGKERIASPARTVAGDNLEIYANVLF